MYFSYTKLKNGDWGLRLQDHVECPPGMVVDVQTKAGSIKHEAIGRQLWQGMDRDGNKVTLFSIADKKKPATEPTTDPGASAPFDSFRDDEGWA